MQAFVVRSESNTTTKQQLGKEEIGLKGSLLSKTPSETLAMLQLIKISSYVLEKHHKMK
jgi:hypothetical protein